MLSWHIDHVIAEPQFDGRVTAYLASGVEVGYIIYHHKGDKLRVDPAISVETAWQKQGIGSAMVQRLRADWSNLPCDLMGLNAAGLALFSKLLQTDPTILAWISSEPDRDALSSGRANRH